LHRVWSAHRAPVVQVDVARAQARIRNAVRAETNVATNVEQPSRVRTNGDRRGGWKRSNVWTPRAVVATALTAAAVMAFAIFNHGAERFGVMTGSTFARTYTTTAGQQATVRLPDGSRAILAPRTTLTVEASSADRVVSLVGEAYFDVQPNVHAPFVVRTGHTTTHVLGTAFDVKRYAGDAGVRIAVASGKVQSRMANHAPVTLTAGMIGRLTDSSVTVTTSGDLTEYTGWTRGRLEFRTTPVPEVLATLERWYGVRFRLADSALSRATVSGRLDFGTTSEAMRALKLLLGVDMTFDRMGDTTFVTLHAPQSNARPAAARRDMRESLTTLREIGR